MMRLIPLVVLCSLVTSPALAQKRTASAMGGATFAASPSFVGGAEVTLPIVPRVEMVGELVIFKDVMIDRAVRHMEDVAESFEAFSRIVLGQQVDVDVDARAPGFHGAAGIRLTTPVTSRSDVFVQGDIGFTRVDPTMRFFSEGRDISTTVGPPLGQAETKPSLGFGGGVRFSISERALVSARYHFIRVFAEEPFAPVVEGGFNVNRVVMGIGYRF